MTVKEFNKNEFQVDDIIEITFNDSSMKKVHLHQGYAYSSRNTPGIHHSKILVVGGEEPIEAIKLSDVKTVTLKVRQQGL